RGSFAELRFLLLGTPLGPPVNKRWDRWCPNLAQWLFEQRARSVHRGRGAPYQKNCADKYDKNQSAHVLKDLKAACVMLRAPR
ncbi:MAG: hypothetical protein OEV53_05955, partial [Nitrospira sp.]|nr:hypothetical protein [Nitrospira sp.]